MTTKLLFIALEFLFCSTNLHQSNSTFDFREEYVFLSEINCIDSPHELGKNIRLESEQYLLKTKGFKATYSVDKKSEYALHLKYSNESLSTHKGILFVQLGHRIIAKEKVDLQSSNVHDLFLDLGTLEPRSFDLGIYFVSKDQLGKILLSEVEAGSKCEN